MQKPRGFLERFPAEAQFWQIVDRLVARIQENRLAQFIEERRSQVPVLARRTVPSPFGSINLPAINPVPEFIPPTLTDRHREILKASVAMDLASIIGFIPVVGDYVAEELTDAYQTRMKGLMTEQEWQLFQKYDVANPLDTLAALRAIIHAQRA